MNPWHSTDPTKPCVCEGCEVNGGMGHLPDPNLLVLAYLVGFRNHSGLNWDRRGYAFMVRHGNEWAEHFYSEALKSLDADIFEKIYWVYLPEAPPDGHPPIPEALAEVKALKELEGKP